MPMDVRMPDGTVIANVPDGTPKDVIRQKWEAYVQTSDRAANDPTKGMGALDKVTAGFGKAVSDLWLGGKQLVAARADANLPLGRVEKLRQEVTDRRALDAPLMQTGAGKAGNFAGNVAVAVPAAFVPGANTVAGAGLIGATTGLLQPSTSTQETVANTALGFGLGAGGQKVGQMVAPRLRQAITARTQTAAEAQSVNAARDEVMAEARKLGYKIPPATINQESTAARAAESIAGKTAIKQTAAVQNQKVTNQLVRDEFGLSKSAPLRVSTLESIRQKAGEAYKAVKQSGDILADEQYLTEIDNLGNVADEITQDFPGFDIAGSAEIQSLRAALGQQGFRANSAVEMMKELRHEASKNLAWNVDDPARKALGLAQREAAGILEDQVIRHLQANGKGALAQAFDKARTTIAKTYSVQAALNEGSGNVVAAKLGAQLRKGKPLSGNLEKIARFASSVDSGVVKESTGSPGVSALVASLASAAGTYGVAAGHPAVAAAAVGTLTGRELARRAMLSKAGQSLATPKYAPRNALLSLGERAAPFAAPVAIGVGNTE